MVMSRHIGYSYRKAIAEQGRIVVSGPYLDDGGAGYLLTIHKAIYVPGWVFLSRGCIMTTLFHTTALFHTN